MDPTPCNTMRMQLLSFQVEIDKHLTEAKAKEINGNYDLFHRGIVNSPDSTNVENISAGGVISSGVDSFAERPQSAAESRRSEKLHSTAKRQEIVGNYDLLSFAPNRQDNADYIKYPSERPASRAKLRELSGSFVFGDDDSFHE